MQDSSEEQPRRKRGVGFWIFVGCGTALLLAAACCGGVFFLAKLAFKEFESAVQTELADNPILREHLGEIEDVAFDWEGVIQEEGDVMVFSVRGSRATGTVRVHREDLEDGEILRAQLQLPSGELVDLLPDETEDR